MTPSIFIARILGPVLVIIGLGLLVEGETFRVMAGDFLRSSALVYLSGLIALVAGLAILNLHHVWVGDWRVLITIFGWLALIGGIMRLLATSFVQRVGESVIAHQRWPIAGAVVTIGLGAFLSLKGYQAVWDVGRRASSHRASATKSSDAIASRSAKRPRRKPAARSGHSS
jgi:hypothetical protein